MRNSTFFWFFILIVLFMGVIIGSTNTVGQRDYFEDAKNDFENSITDPNHTNLPLIVEKDKTTKIAQKLENGIYKGFKKILKKIASE